MFQKAPRFLRSAFSAAADFLARSFFKAGKAVTSQKKSRPNMLDIPFFVILSCYLHVS